MKHGRRTLSCIFNIRHRWRRTSSERDTGVGTMPMDNMVNVLDGKLTARCASREYTLLGVDVTYKNEARRYVRQSGRFTFECSTSLNLEN